MLTGFFRGKPVKTVTKNDHSVNDMKFLAIEVVKDTLPMMDIMQLRFAALINVRYFSCARFKEAQSLETDTLKVLTQGNLQLVFVKGKKTNSFLFFLMPIDEKILVTN